MVSPAVSVRAYNSSVDPRLKLSMPFGLLTGNAGAFTEKPVPSVTEASPMTTLPEPETSAMWAHPTPEAMSVGVEVLRAKS